MRSKAFSIILEDCLQRLDRGEDLTDLLADFPELGDELKPLLLVAMASRAFPLPNPSQTAQRLGRNQMLAEMNKREVKKAFRKKTTVPISSRWIGGLVRAARSRGFSQFAYSYRLAMVSLVLVLSSGYFTLSASASSQPGDLLYNLKLGLQQAGLDFTFYENMGNEPVQTPSEPWEFGGYIWSIDEFYRGLQDPGNETPDYFNDLSGIFNPDGEDLDVEKDKELAAAEREVEKDLKEEEKDLAAAEKDAEKDLKEEEKDAAETEKETEQDLKEEEKDIAEDEKEAEKDLKEEEKDAAKANKEAEKEDKKSVKTEKDRVKDK
jgi:hypothetical protein